MRPTLDPRLAGAAAGDPSRLSAARQVRPLPPIIPAKAGPKLPCNQAAGLINARMSFPRLRLDPGFRRDDRSKGFSLYTHVIPASATASCAARA